MADHERLLLGPRKVACPACGAEVGARCVRPSGAPLGGLHKSRKKLAQQVVGGTWVIVEEKKLGCRCTNHLGKPKQKHRSRQAAVSWAASNWVRKHAMGGMRFEAYPCPTSEGRHIRTARTARNKEGAVRD